MLNIVKVVHMLLKNVLITSSSAKVPLIVELKKAMAKYGGQVILFGGDNDMHAVSQYCVDKFWHMPSDNELSLQIVKEYCLQNNIGYIIPTRDKELEFWAKTKKDLEREDIFVMVSEYEKINQCFNKYNLYSFCKANNLPIIKTSENINDIIADKYVVKEKNGAGSRNIGLNLSKENAIKHARILDEPIFQPFIHAKEYNVDMYVDKKGICRGVIVLDKIKIIPPDAHIMQKVDISAIENLGKQVAECIGFYGHAMMEVFQEANGKLHIIECNLRIAAASVCSFMSGLDTFYWFLLESNNNNLDDYKFVKSKENIKLVKYYTMQQVF